MKTRRRGRWNSPSALLFREIACFNGGLFENTTALPLSTAQLTMLADAAGTDWSAVEPSIFGTLLTRALDPRGRHKLGAEYTPRCNAEWLRDERRLKKPQRSSTTAGIAHKIPPHEKSRGPKESIYSGAH